MSDTLPGGATGAATPGASSLESDLQNLRDDVARLTDTLSTLVSDGAATARNAAREGVDTARETVASAADDLSDAIVENPLTAVMIALGIGYVVGALGRSRR
ncbi:DUF883 family protein [Hansschlegelia zhihuaiae]|uniref:DUF883 family protein n=1 Tax=Hansschlegelia zhihuaiae TaxID=405005 RepID=A0A4V1KIV4_9HYPH|nr:hypothetical protein [Hansschlegelia zhihuaiae]RXF72002.1 hypothetical protein EK403_14350 [Hansschlegelia zhihuaiae]